MWILPVLAGQQPVAPENGNPTGDPKPEADLIKPDMATIPKDGQTAATGNTKNGHPAQNDIFPPMGNPAATGPTHTCSAPCGRWATP